MAERPPSQQVRRILVLNGGTSTVKAAIAEIADGRVTVTARRTVEGRGRAPEALFGEAIEALLPDPGDVEAVGHRVVHGGNRFHEPVVVEAEVEAAIESLVPLAPLHNPVALAGLRAARARLGDRPMIAVFDTAFHRERPDVARRYALSAELTESLGLWRYGFHGIAHASLVEGTAALEGTSPSDVTAVTLQLGQGCSACAIRRGVSIETSMGFTPLEGLVMGTRSGDVDPGLVLYLFRRGRTVQEIEELLEKRSGLLGVGGSADMRELLRAETRGDRQAALAIELFVRRIVMTVGGYLTLLGGDGALVFGGGIGENAAAIRERVAQGLSAWNLRLDPARNAANAPGCISAPGARPAYVVHTDEETTIALAVRDLLNA